MDLKNNVGEIRFWSSHFSSLKLHFIYCQCRLVYLLLKFDLLKAKQRKM
jgi:hypothetical protein